LTPRLRNVLLVVNLTVMLLPLGGITFLRLYESEIIRQKETALFAQGALVAAVFRSEVTKALRVDDERLAALPYAAEGGYGLPLAPRWRSPVNPDFSYVPVVPSLTLDERRIRNAYTGRWVPAAPAAPAAQTAGHELTPLLLRAQSLSLDGIRVVDPSAAVVASSYGEEGRSLATWEEVQRALQGEYVSLLRRRPGGRSAGGPLAALGLGTAVQVVTAIPVVHNARVLGVVVLSGIPSQITEFVYGNRGQLLLALAALMLVVTVLSVISSLMISEPIQAVIRQTERVASGDPRGLAPISFPMLHEVRMLSQAIARMAGIIAERSAYITAFARSVSHEFKTPLTSITGTTELLLDHHDEMPPEERRRFLANLNADALRLSSLVRRLLDLARAEVEGPTKEACAVDPTLDAACERATRDGASVVRTGAATGVKVRMAQELLETIVANVVDNVRHHCPPGTRAEVSASFAPSVGGASASAGTVSIRVADDGPGISEANQSKVFQPFFTTARGSGGTGLGLAIVQAIVKSHGGGVELTSSSKGTVVTLRLLAAG
jgi:signal transduction histidine kinase